MRIGSIFTGVGGFELGLERAGLGPVVWQCESNAYCREILGARWPHAELYTDVCTMQPERLPYVEVICGGFPCQDISQAGRGDGLGGARSGLWFEMLRIIKGCRPKYIAIENVAALRSRGMDEVLEGLAACGYDAVWFSVQAHDIGAPHRRERVFIVAYQPDDRRERGGWQGWPSIPRGPELDGCGAPVDRAVASGRSMADAGVIQLQPHGNSGLVAQAESGGGDSGPPERLGARDRGADLVFPPGPFDADGWARWLEQGGPPPAVRRGADGLPPRARYAQLAALGNAIVPGCAEVSGHVILGIEKMLSEGK